MRKTVSGMMLTLLLIGISASISLLSPSTAQPSEGDWDVIGVEVVENETIELSGNITIKAGGSLTLRNVTLRMNVEHDGQYGMSVEEGGALSIYDSNISSTTGFRFFFSVMVGSFVMKNSELHDAGGGGGADWSGEPRKRGLYVQADDAVIDGNLIADCLGVFLCLSRNSSVANNRLITDYGITITHNVPPFQPIPRNNSILNNTIQGSLEYGITIGAGNNNIVANNTVLDTMVGIFLMGSWDNVVTNNRVIPEHHVDPWGGIVLWAGGGNNTIANNTIKMERPQGIIDGIEVVGSVNNRIEGNVIENLIGGITLSYAHNNIVANNNLSNIWRGMDPTHSSSPSPDAIQLYHSTGNIIVNNRISGAQSNAILLWDMSRNNVLQANVINSSYNGISLHYSSDNNTIVNNVVGQIDSWTIIFDDSRGNIAYHNNFLDSVIEAYDNGLNYWSFGRQGNYWGDYEGEDKDGDGVWDVPYCITPNGTDNFPLIRPEPITFVPIQVLEPATPPLWPPDPINAVVATEETWKDTAVTMDGITVKNGGNLTLQNMTIMLEGGISVESGGSLYIFNSKITAVDPNYGGYAFLVVGADEFVMKNSELSYAGFCFQTDFPGGLSLLATNATIENNVFTHNYRAICGGWFQKSQFSRIANNTILYSYDGIVSDKDILNNRISKIISAGVYAGPNDSHIVGNNISHVWTAAMMLNWTYDEPPTTVMTNTISSSEMGILLYSKVTKASVVNNTIHDVSRWAIKISKSEYSSPANVVANNTILNCTGGIYLAEGSLGTLIYGNNIINSPNSSDMGSNSWDYNGEGNYWNDYTGIDSNEDGIGDTPYNIPPNGVDRYPLIVPAVWNFQNPIPVNWQGKTYPVALSSNSTITTFRFNQPQKQISFNLTELSGTKGYCNITIPNDLLKGPWTYTMDGETPSFIDFSEDENATHSFIYITYIHASTFRITIQGTWVIPEFPSTIILPLFILVTLIATIIWKKKRKAKPQLP